MKGNYKSIVNQELNVFTRNLSSVGLTHGQGIHGGKTDRLGPLIRRNPSRSITPTRYTSETICSNMDQEISVIEPKRKSQVILGGSRCKQIKNLTCNKNHFKQQTPVNVREVRQTVHKRVPANNKIIETRKFINNTYIDINTEQHSPR